MPETTEIRQPKVGELAPDTRIFRAGEAEKVPLSRLWLDGPAVLVFLRHFG